MPARTQCPRCETVLNVPSGAEGRKLKCPRCTTTFRVGDPGSSARSSLPGVDTASPVSSPSMPNIPTRREEPDLPVVSGDLRDQFHLPLMGEDDDAPIVPKPKSRPRPPNGPGSDPSSEAIPVLPSGSSPYAEADAAGLIEDDEPVRPRKRTSAEARSTTRRCTCGGVVPAGMSLCPRCGLDLETGTRDTTFDVLEVEALPPRAVAAPFGVMIVSLTSALVGVGLALTALVLYLLRTDAPNRWGFLLLSAVSAFGVYAAVRLIRNRSARLLLVALMLGGLIDVAALIVLPITLASSVPVLEFPEYPDEKQGFGGEDRVPMEEHAVPRIVPLTERINWGQINLGLAILGVTAIVSIYLTSPEVRRYSQGR